MFFCLLLQCPSLNCAHCGMVWKISSLCWPYRTKLSLTVKTDDHRRTGSFRPGGAVDHLPKKFLQIAQIFTKQSKRNKGHTMQQHRPEYWHTKVPQYRFSGSIYTCQVWAQTIRRHKQTFGKIATTVVSDKDENLSWSGLQWHWSCHSIEMTPLPIILAALFLIMKVYEIVLGSFLQ